LRISVQAEGYGRCVDVPLDIRTLNRNFIWPDIDGMDENRQSNLQNKEAGNNRYGSFVLSQPHQWQCAERNSDEQPTQRKRNFFVDVIRARHERMRVEQKLIIAEINPHGETQQHDD